MSKDRDDVWDPFGELTKGLSAKQLIEIERAETWALYRNSGAGSPYFFDYWEWLQSRNHEYETKQETERERGR